MSLIEVPTKSLLGEIPPPDVFEKPPVVAVTPCDPLPVYTIADGLRRVAPYWFSYTTWCKERMRGRGILDIFASEFRDRPREYYEESIKSGAITVNGKQVDTDYKLQNGQRITNQVHRHEPPVTSDGIGVIHEDDDLVVINKPASIPVHPAGRYKHNTIIEIMRHERGGSFKALPVNRLDRLTSGIMFIAKHPKAAEALTTQITARTVRKEYLARVAGRFPDGDVTCEQPILQISPKLGLNRVRANGKTAKTVFRRLAYYPDGSDDQESDKQRKPGKGYSIVLAAPLTGRTHQIRVHLQFLGFPIANDPIYANQRVWRFDLGAGDADGVANTDEDVITRLSRMGKDEVADAVAYHDEMVDDYNSRRAEKMLDLRCSICACPLYSDPGEHELSLWLHSLRYADMHGRWSYTSPYPTWALPPSASDVDELIHGAVKGNIIEAAKDTLPETLE